MITPATLIVNGDEKAYDYFEAQEQAPDYSGFHRYRKIYVKRNGNIAEYREDMGKASDFKGAKQLHIPSLWVHSVAELIDLADYLRWDTGIDVKDWLSLGKYNAA